LLEGSMGDVAEGRMLCTQLAFKSSHLSILAIPLCNEEQPIETSPS
jgi:hypothetical protein